MYLQGIVGPQALQSLTPGSPGSVRLGQLNDLIVSQLHGKWYEQCYRGNMYSFGSPPYTLSGCTVLTSASCTPIIAIWNPSYSTVNCVLSKAKMQIMSTTGSNTGVAPG